MIAEAPLPGPQNWDPTKSIFRVRLLSEAGNTKAVSRILENENPAVWKLVVASLDDKTIKILIADPAIDTRFYDEIAKRGLADEIRTFAGLERLSSQQLEEAVEIAADSRNVDAFEAAAENLLRRAPSSRARTVEVLKIYQEEFTPEIRSSAKKLFPEFN